MNDMNVGDSHSGSSMVWVIKTELRGLCYKFGNLDNKAPFTNMHLS